MKKALPAVPLELQGYLREATVEHVMKGRPKRTVHDLPPTATVWDGLTMMRDHKFGCVLVSEAQTPCGIFSRQDAVNSCLLAGKDPHTETIEAHMSRGVVSASPDMTVAAALSLLSSHNIHHLPVASFMGDAIDEDTRIVDVLTSRDFALFLLGQDPEYSNKQ